MPKPKLQFGIVVLAAGSSSRLGSPKQLLLLKGSTLVKRAALLSLEVTDKVVVVIGARAGAIQKELQGLPLVLEENEAFTEGIASSIRVGLTTLIKEFDVEAVVFVVCDQPYLSPEIISQLIEEATNSAKGIVASAYGNTFGIPVLFRKNYFSELLELKGDAGAKKLIMKHLPDVGSISFPQGKVDIDTQEDWEDFKSP